MGIYLIYFKVYNSGRTKCCFYDFFFFSKLVLGARFSRKWEVGEWGITQNLAQTSHLNLYSLL